MFTSLCSKKKKKKQQELVFVILAILTSKKKSLCIRIFFVLTSTTRLGAECQQAPRRSARRSRDAASQAENSQTHTSETPMIIKDISIKGLLGVLFMLMVFFDLC